MSFCLPLFPMPDNLLNGLLICINRYAYKKNLKIFQKADEISQKSKIIIKYTYYFVFFLQPCHVVYTDYRPVPLQHYIHPGGSEGIHLVVDDNGKFREDSFSEAMGKIGGGESGQSKRKSQKEGSDIFKIVNMVMERNFAPVIIFSFSKKECEAYALQMSKLDFNSSKLFIFQCEIS